MGKLLLIFACVLSTVIAGRIPVSNDRISWWEWQRQNVRPTLLDLVTLRWQMNPRIAIELENRGMRPMRQDDRKVNSINRVWENQENNEEPDLEQRYNRVPLTRQIIGGIERNLPTTDANSNRLLHLGRRRQQQLSQQMEDINRDENIPSIVRDESIRRDDDRLVRINRRRQDQIQDEMTPIRINRIGEGRRVGPMPEEDILQFIRRDNRLNNMSDDEIIEMLRRQRKEKMERRLKEQVEQRVEDVRDEVRRGRVQEEMTPRRMNRIEEESRIENRQRQEQTEQERLMGRLKEQVEQRVEDLRDEVRRDQVQEEMTPRRMNRIEEQSRIENRQRQEQTEQERLMGRRVEQEEDVVDRTIDNLKSVRRDDERLVHVNRRRLQQTQEDQTPLRIVRIGEDRRLGDVDSMIEQNILQLIRRDNRLVNLSDAEIIEMVRRNRQQNTQERSEERAVDQDVQRNELPSVRRDDERLVHINRRRLGQTQEEIMPRRVSRIGEGRRVDPMPEEDILKLIRKDNRLNELNDEEITEMLRRQRLEKIERRRMEQDQEREEVVQGDVRQEEMIPRRVSRIGEGRRVDPMSEEDILKLIRMDNRLNELNDDEIIEMLRRQRLEKMERRRMEQDQEREEVVQGDDLQSVRRDDERLVHINRRRLDQTL